MVVREGSNVTLKCAATGSPTPNITWRRENGEKIMVHGGSEGELLPNGNKRNHFSFALRQGNKSLRISYEKTFSF